MECVIGRPGITTSGEGPESVRRPRLGLHADRVLRHRVDHPPGAGGRDRQAQLAGPLEDGVRGEIRECVVPGAGGRRHPLPRRDPVGAAHEHRAGTERQAHGLGALGQHASEPRVPADHGWHRLLCRDGHRHLEPVLVQREALDDPAAERPALVEVDGDGVVAHDRPRPVVDDAVDRMGSHRDGQLVGLAVEHEPAQVDAAGPRRHGVAAPGDRVAGITGDQQLPAPDGDGAQPPAIPWPHDHPCIAGLKHQLRLVHAHPLRASTMNPGPGHTTRRPLGRAARACGGARVTAGGRGSIGPVRRPASCRGCRSTRRSAARGP